MNRLVVAPLYYFYVNFRDKNFPQVIDFEGGYKLKSFDPNLLTPVLDFYKDAFSEYDKKEILKCTHAIYYEYDAPEDQNPTPPEVVADIHHITQTLRLIKRTRTVPAVILLRNKPVNQLTIADAIAFSGKPPSEISFIDHDADMEHFKTEDVIIMQNYWTKVKGLWHSHGGQYHRILNALIYFEIAHRTAEYKPRLADFVTALESLFNTSKDQITYAIRTRCSYFLEQVPDKRVELSVLIKDIYDLRSLFIHGQATPNKILENAERQKKLLMETENITRACLQKVLDKDLISVFATDKPLKQEFLKLELGATSILN